MADGGDGYVSGFPDDGLALLAFRLDRGEWDAETEADAAPAEDVFAVFVATGAAGGVGCVVRGETLDVAAAAAVGTGANAEAGDDDAPAVSLDCGDP
ncbi:hypothetical protein CcaCcLH18_12975 [Colletotrichum camelliae]|nr:hypothetical protein CcaCcLH18_12975 [Colletotrichum camelliae]